MVYEDGDCEDMTTAEVKECLVAEKTVNNKTKALLRGQAKSSTAQASPSDFCESNNTDNKKTKSTKTNAKDKVNAAEQSSTKKRKRPRAETTAPVEEEQEEEEGGGEGDTVPMRLVPSGVEDWKYYVLKSFGDLGDFNGLVISLDKPFYKVNVCERGEGERGRRCMDR